MFKQIISYASNILVVLKALWYLGGTRYIFHAMWLSYIDPLHEYLFWLCMDYMFYDIITWVNKKLACFSLKKNVLGLMMPYMFGSMEISVMVEYGYSCLNYSYVRGLQPICKRSRRWSWWIYFLLLFLLHMVVGCFSFVILSTRPLTHVVDDWDLIKVSMILLLFEFLAWQILWCIGTVYAIYILTSSWSYMYCSNSCFSRSIVSWCWCIWHMMLIFYEDVCWCDMYFN